MRYTQVIFDLEVQRNLEKCSFCLQDRMLISFYLKHVLTTGTTCVVTSFPIYGISVPESEISDFRIQTSKW